MKEVLYECSCAGGVAGQFPSILVIVGESAPQPRLRLSSFGFQRLGN